METPEPTTPIDTARQRRRGVADAKGQFLVAAVAFALLNGVVRTCTREERERVTAPGGVVDVPARRAEVGLTREISHAGTWRGGQEPDCPNRRC
jgi:hypothetical protein